MVVTGLTRNGLWLIEDGRIARPITNLRFTQSYHEALGPGAIRAVGSDRTLVAAEWPGAFLVPSLHLAIVELHRWCEGLNRRPVV